MKEILPHRTAFMDEGMLDLWWRMEPLPGDLRLYGGTALALYLSHRTSRDFDFATPLATVDEDLLHRIPLLQDARIQGGHGMMDADVPAKGGPINITFMECGHMVPMPSRPPLLGQNGVAVAHPLDLTAAKIHACVSRETLRDHIDVAACIRAWPQWTRAAIDSLVEDGRHMRTRLLAMLSDPPPGISHELEKAELETLRGFTKSLQAPRRNRGACR